MPAISAQDRQHIEYAITVTELFVFGIVHMTRPSAGAFLAALSETCLRWALTTSLRPSRGTTCRDLQKAPLGSKNGNPWEPAFICKSLMYKKEFGWGTPIAMGTALLPGSEMRGDAAHSAGISGIEATTGHGPGLWHRCRCDVRQTMHMH